MADTKKDALVAFDAFIKIYAIKYEKAVECLTKDREALLTFYDFPAEHWKHLRTSNPVESTFATVRHRTIRSKGCLSNKTALAMVFELAQAAEKQLPPDLARHQNSTIARRSATPTTPPGLGSRFGSMTPNVRSNLNYYR